MSSRGGRDTRDKLFLINLIQVRNRANANKSKQRSDAARDDLEARKWFDSGKKYRWQVVTRDANPRMHKLLASVRQLLTKRSLAARRTGFEHVLSHTFSSRFRDRDIFPSPSALRASRYFGSCTLYIIITTLTKRRIIMKTLTAITRNNDGNPAKSLTISRQQPNV